MSMDPEAAAKEVLQKIMEGETVWELAEAKIYRQRLELLTWKIKNVRGGKKQVKKTAMKTAKNLRRKIKHLDQNNARVFESKLELNLDYSTVYTSYSKRKELLVRIEIEDDRVTMSFSEERYDWSDYSVNRKLE